MTDDVVDDRLVEHVLLDIRAEVRGLRDDSRDLRDEFHGLRNEFHGLRNALHGLRTETREGFEHMRLLLATVTEGQRIQLEREIADLRSRVTALEARAPSS